MRHRTPAPVAVLALLPLLACASEEPAEATADAASAEVSMTLPVTTSSADARLHFVQGLRAWDMGRIRDARPHFRQASEADPGFALGHYYLARTATSLEGYLAALRRAAAGTAAASEAERLLVEIDQAGLEDDAERQLELARRLTVLHPESPRAWLQLGQEQAGMNRVQAARRSLERALEASPDFVPAHMMLGNTYLFGEPRDLDRGERTLRRAVELAPDEPVPHDLLADAYRMQGRLEEAAAEYTRASELDPDGALPLQQRGHVHSFLGNYERARADYDAAIARGQDDEPATFAVYRSYVSVHEGRPSAAVEELRDLLARIDGMGLPDPRGAKIFALTGIARIALHEGMPDVAEEALAERAGLVTAQADEIGTEAARLSNRADVLVWEGRLAARGGDFETALSRAREAIRLLEPVRDPTRDYDAHEAMGLAHLLRGDAAEAVAHYEQADPNDIYTDHHHALALEAAGRTGEAAALFEKVAGWRFNDLGLALVRRDALAKASAGGA